MGGGNCHCFRSRCRLHKTFSVTILNTGDPQDSLLSPLLSTHDLWPNSALTPFTSLQMIPPQWAILRTVTRRSTGRSIVSRQHPFLQCQRNEGLVTVSEVHALVHICIKDAEVDMVKSFMFHIQVMAKKAHSEDQGKFGMSPKTC